MTKCYLHQRLLRVDCSSSCLDGEGLEPGINQPARPNSIHAAFGQLPSYHTFVPVLPLRHLYGTIDQLKTEFGAQ